MLLPAIPSKDPNDRGPGEANENPGGVVGPALEVSGLVDAVVLGEEVKVGEKLNVRSIAKKSGDRLLSSKRAVQKKTVRSWGLAWDKNST